MMLRVATGSTAEMREPKQRASIGFPVSMVKAPS
jgi:hypothetical protein